jgi:hypothetical protein
VLERQSLILTAERRMGKTSVIKKMAVEPLPNMLVKLRSLEGLYTPLEFVEAVLHDVQQDLSSKERAMGGVRSLLEQLSGAEIKGFKLPKSIEQHWKTILTKTIEDLMVQQEGMVIFFWDEMPMMLDNINRDLGETVTMEILTTLRYLRQTHSNLRMVFTGSILFQRGSANGLHHVVTQLKKVGAAGATTNDMHQEEVTPLDLDDAILLAQELLTGAKIDVKDLAESIAESVDLVPYYIHHIVDELQQINSPITQQNVSNIILDNLYTPSNRWDMAHYRERIDTYYELPIVPFALGVLDELAVTANPLPLPDLLQRLQVQSNLQNLDREMLLKVLSLLQRDHYIGQQSAGAYAFRFPLIQQYWKLSLGLG